MRGRFVANFDFGEGFLNDIELWPDIKQCITNVGWELFHDPGSGFHLDITIEVASTMHHGQNNNGNEVIMFCTDELYWNGVEGSSIALQLRSQEQ